MSSGDCWYGWPNSVGEQGPVGLCFLGLFRGRFGGPSGSLLGEESIDAKMPAEGRGAVGEDGAPRGTAVWGS
jgi:hypothetical protein